jgi:hypothetical protein
MFLIVLVGIEVGGGRAYKKVYQKAVKGNNPPLRWA